MYLESSRYAIHHRHIDIEKHQLRVKRLYLIQRLLAIFRLAADREGVGVQELAHGMARDVMIVNEQDSSRKSPLSLAHLQSQLSPSCYQREPSSIRGCL